MVSGSWLSGKAPRYWPAPVHSSNSVPVALFAVNWMEIGNVPSGLQAPAVTARFWISQTGVRLQSGVRNCLISQQFGFPRIQTRTKPVPLLPAGNWARLTGRSASAYAPRYWLLIVHNSNESLVGLATWKSRPSLNVLSEVQLPTFTVRSKISQATIWLLSAPVVSKMRIKMFRNRIIEIKLSEKISGWIM